MPNGAIGTDQIADGSITAAKINGGTGVWVGSGENIYHDAGNVGIGTDNPGAKLDVTGNANISGNATVSGSIGIGSTNSSLSLNHFAYSDVTMTLQGRPGDPYLAYFMNSAGTAEFYVRATGDVFANGAVTTGGNMTANGKGVVVGEESNLRIVRGWGTANTTVGTVHSAWNGSGYTYKKISQGVVEVYYNTPFTGTPSVTANATTGGTIICVFRGLNAGTNPDRNGFQIIMYDTNGNGRDWPFNFIAVGPR